MITIRSLGEDMLTFIVAQFIVDAVLFLLDTKIHVKEHSAVAQPMCAN